MAKVLVKGVMEGMGVSPATFCFFDSLTPAFSGIPKQTGTKSELVASALPSGGPKSGRKYYVIPAFSGIPKQRGTKSELVASALPSGGPTSGRKCYVTPTFLRIPNKGDKIKAQKKPKKKTKIFPRCP